MNRFCTYVLAGALASAPLAAQADEEPGGLLVDFLQDTLSGESRTIKVSGLEGAFSSRATIEKLTVADDVGIWLTINNAVLDWNRLALLQGRFAVNTLTADSIQVDRSPNPAPEEPDLPSPEATPFQLPDLPVAIDLGELRVDRIELGQALAGTAASLSLDGALKLADGTLDTKLHVERLDRPGDVLALTAGFANLDSMITLDLTLNESAGGLLSRVLQLPGQPTVRLSAQGVGPVSKFNANIELDTNDTRRLQGQVVLAALVDDQPDTSDSIGFSADLTGDISPLLEPDYRPFFGPGMRANLKGQRDPDGRLTLDSLAVRTQALNVTGALALAPGSVLETANVKVAITPPDGQAAVVLPIPGADTTLAAAEILARKSAGADWSVTALIDRLGHPALTLQEGRIQAQGALDQRDGFQIQGRVTAALDGFVLADPALAAASGSDLSFAGNIETRGDGVFRLSDMVLRGDDYQATGDIQAEGLSSGLKIGADLRVGAADLSRFSQLAGQPLGGAVSAEIAGHAAPLSGSFGLDLDLRASDLSAGIDKIDPLIAGATTLKLKAERGIGGIRIEEFDLAGQALSASAAGTLTSQSGALSLRARLNDIGGFVPQSPGPLELSGDLTRNGEILSGQLELNGPRSSHAELTGQVGLNGDATINFDAILNDLQRFLPELNGQIAAKGTANRRDGIWRIDTRATGPADIDAQIAGSWNETSATADLTAKGKARLDVANLFIKPNSVRGLAAFDLALRGKPGLDALSGTITTSGATLALPAIKQQIEAIAATVSISNSAASVQVTARPRAGGSVNISGPVALSAPFNGDLRIGISDVILTDNLSYDSIVNGSLSFSGPLAGNANLAGRIDIGETNINIAKAGGSVTSAPIPPIRHINEPGGSRATRARAGLIEQNRGGSGPDIGLDLYINAPNKIFARGRGLRAELGGAIHVKGSTGRLIPTGQVGLIRGQFTFLGRNLELDEGQVTLLGNLVPYLNFKSSASTSEGTATMEISGLIDAPVIKVYSDPPRPSEEALALLLFGDNIQDLSPLALARLAGSLAELSGRGGATEGKLRDETGADEADLSLSGLGLGGYVASNVYTDFNVNTRGESELNINLDLNRNLTVSGTVDSEGETGLGIFFKRDY